MARTYKSILIMQTAFLGDVFLCIPLMKALRLYFPESQIALLCRKNVGAFFLETGLVNQVIEVDKGNGQSLEEAFRQTKDFDADLIMSPHRSFRTALWVLRLQAEMSVGFWDLWSLFAFKKRVIRQESAHDVLRQLSLLKGLKIKVGNLPPEVMSLEVAIKENPRYEKFRGAIVLAPGSQWNTKRWLPEGYIDVGNRFAKLGKKIVIVGTAAEKKLCGEITAQIPNSVDLCGQTNVIELAQVLKVAQVLICNDSGTMHVATAVGTSVVSIFGPTVTKLGYAPWGKKSKVVEAKLGCRPCGSHGHQQCPIKTHECMKKVRADRVFQVAEEFLT